MELKDLKNFTTELLTILEDAQEAALFRHNSEPAGAQYSTTFLDAFLVKLFLENIQIDDLLNQSYCKINSRLSTSEIRGA